MKFCYCADKNLVIKGYLHKSVNTLLKTNPTASVHIFVDFYKDDELNKLLTNDSRITYHFKDEFENYIQPDCKNLHNKLGVMTLVRLILPKLFDDDKIIYIDVDTIVRGSLDDLCNINLQDLYVAGVRQGAGINAGVLVLNLEQIRKDKKDDELLYLMNNQWFFLHDQDIINRVFWGKIKYIDPTYNSCMFTKPLDNPIIVHCTPIKPWQKNCYFYQEWENA